MITDANQLAAIKADILANPDLNLQPVNSDTSDAIAKLYNLPAAAPAVSVWKTNAKVTDIYDAIDWSKYTPTDAADGTALYTNRALNIQTKQMNLQNILVARDTLNAAKVNVRGGLRDAVVLLPAGAAGAPVSAGGASGATVLAACVRPATRIEALLCAASQGSDTTGTVTARVLTFEGKIDYQSIDAARALP